MQTPFYSCRCRCLHAYSTNKQFHTGATEAERTGVKKNYFWQADRKIMRKRAKRSLLLRMLWTAQSLWKMRGMFYSCSMVDGVKTFCPVLLRIANTVPCLLYLFPSATLPGCERTERERRRDGEGTGLLAIFFPSHCFWFRNGAK